MLARSSFREVGCIYRPGFYRVDPLMGRSGFYRACAEGIPFHHTSRVSQAYDSWRQRKVEAGREKHFVALNKRIAADALEMRRRKNGKKRIPTRSVRFFRALAMAGVVTKQHEE